MSEKKELTKKELDSVSFRMGIVRQKEMEILLLKRESQLYMSELAKKYEIDGEFSISPEGVISKVEKTESAETVEKK